MEVPSSATLRGRIAQALRKLGENAVNNRVLLLEIAGAVVTVLIAKAKSTSESEAQAPAPPSEE